jgi:HAE1 family hydrophobic/amphiphilic exporter-1
VFLPLVFVEGVAGQLFRDQALTVTIAILMSLVVSLTLIPMLSALKATSPLAYPPRHPRAAGGSLAVVVSSPSPADCTASQRGFGAVVFGVIWAVVRVFRVAWAFVVVR